MRQTPCFVYLMTSSAPLWPDDDRTSEGFSVFKVGISNSPAGRLGQLRTSSPYRIDLHRAWRLPSREEALFVEKKFHRLRQECRLTGEWFYDRVEDSRVFIDGLVCYAGERALFPPTPDFRGQLIRFMFSTGMSETECTAAYEEAYGGEVEQNSPITREEILATYMAALGMAP